MLTAQFDVRINDQDLARISVPCLVYCGDIDPFHSGAKESARHIPEWTVCLSSRHRPRTGLVAQ